MKRIILTLTLALFTLPILNAQDLPSYVPTDGLVAYYPFNGNANDASGSGHHGTVNGATLSSDRDGNENSSYSFDGIDDDISNSNEFLPLNIDFTISVWFNTNDIYQGSQCILNSLEHTGIGLIFNHNYNSSKMNLFLGDGISFWDVDGLGGMKSDYQNDTWYNIILTKQNDLYKVYLNGVVDIETNISNSLNYNNLVGFRFGTISPDSGYEQFFGKLDDIGFWNRALTVQEIQNLYTSSNGDILLNGVVSAENNQIKNVVDPTDNQDAATKSYVDRNLNSFSGSYNDLTDIPVLYSQDEVDALIDALRAELGDQIDNDGDGYTEDGGDCDDSDASISPGAEEIEDGIDNDCDGEIDEGFVLTSTEMASWYGTNTSTTQYPQDANLHVSFVSSAVQNYVGLNTYPDNRNVWTTTSDLQEVDKNSSPYLSYTFNLTSNVDFDRFVIHGAAPTTNGIKLQLRWSVDNFESSLGDFNPGGSSYNLTSVDLSTMQTVPVGSVEFRVYFYAVSGNVFFSGTGPYSSLDGTNSYYTQYGRAFSVFGTN